MSKSPAIINPTDPVSSVSTELDQDYLDEDTWAEVPQSIWLGGWLAQGDILPWKAIQTLKRKHSFLKSISYPHYPR